MLHKRFVLVTVSLLMLAMIAGTAFAATVVWKGVTWNDTYGTIAVNSAGNLEVTPSTCETDKARCRGAAHYNTPVDFRSASTPWIEVTLTDLGPGMAGGQLWVEDEKYQQPGDNGAWTQIGAWHNRDTYHIYWWDYDTGSRQFVDLGIDRQSGEQILTLGMRDDGTVDYCFNNVLVHTTSNITPRYFGDVYLAALNDLSNPEQTVTFTNYRTGTDYMTGYSCNEGPVTSNVEAFPNPAAVGSEVELTALVDNRITGGSNIASAEYKLDANPWTAMSAQDSSFDHVSEVVEATFTAPEVSGITNLCVRGADEADADDPGEPSCTMLVVYDPDSGFVTGGGWIDSPECAYMPALCGEGENMTGKGNFAFVSKYKRGATAPSGNTEFMFQAADLNFRSSSYDWLVVTGSNYAKFKGEGTINNMMAPNSDPYKFQIWAGDSTGTGGEDTFRIKIWYEEGSEVIVYDNGMNQAIGKGNIVVHSGKK